MDILSLGKTPISEESPTGKDTTYLPEFEEIQNEIDKLSVVTDQAGQVNWNRVLDLSGRILSEKSKNILVAAYMAEALMKTRQLEGLQQGTRVIKDLVENYWDTFYPPKKRKKGRINALRWWYEHAEAFLKNHEPAPVPPQTVDAIKQTLSELDGLLAEKTDDAPILRPLIQRVDQFPVEAAQPESEPEPEPAAENIPAPSPETPAPESTQSTEAGEGPKSTAEGPDAGKAERPADTPADAPAEKAAPKPAPAAKREPAPSAPPAMTQEPESDKEANKTLSSTLDILGRLSRYYLNGNAANPLPYRLNRIQAWLTIDSLPMVQEENKTPLPPPDPMIKNRLEQQIAERDYENAVISAEARLREHLFWLDLSRFSAQGLQALGDKYGAAREMLCQETAMFVKRLPGIENLAFSDGTPFCDAETRQWIKTITGTGAAEAALAAPAGSTAQKADSRHAEIETEALELVQNKKVVEAVQLLQDSLASSASGRDALIFRIGLCRVLLDAGKVEPALPQLETLESLIQSHGIEDWEPDLALQGLQLIYAGFSDCSRQQFKDQAVAVFDRIARINPAAACKISGT
ncbi:MAG: type VI secretion system protein TssA [Thermodesulfobacteriota bacterium]